MKKIFIALSFLAALTFGVGSALAVPGVPDNTPGTDFTTPFMVSHDRVSPTGVPGPGQTTLLNLSEVRGWATDFHFFFYTTKSVYIADAWIPITHWGTIMKDIGTIIEGMSDQDRTRLTITFEGQDYYAGYIVADNWIYQWNAPAGIWQRVRGANDNVIGSIYMLDLSQGMAAASNLPMREVFTPGFVSYPDTLVVDPDLAIYQDYWTRWAITGSNPNLSITDQMPTVLGTYERWSAVALHAATARVWNLPIDVGFYATNWAPGTFPNQWWAPACGQWSLYPEYYILNATGRTYFMIYQSGLPNGTTFHMFVINAAEDYLSTTIPIDEVTFLNAEFWIPSGLKVTYPYSGIFNWTSADTSATGTQLTWAEFLGWSWQQADNGAASAATNWQIMKEMARDVGTSGTFAPQPVHIVP